MLITVMWIKLLLFHFFRRAASFFEVELFHYRDIKNICHSEKN